MKCLIMVLGMFLECIFGETKDTQSGLRKKLQTFKKKLGKLVFLK